MYRRLVLEGEPFVYYRGRKKKGGGGQLQVYFGTGVIGAIGRTQMIQNVSVREIQNYQPFARRCLSSEGKATILKVAEHDAAIFTRRPSIPEAEFLRSWSSRTSVQEAKPTFGNTGEEHFRRKALTSTQLRENSSRARTHAIGELQNIRAKLRGLSRRPGSVIFSSQTTHEHWAFHHGGRSELQFNIGLEKLSIEHELRHGVPLFRSN